MKTGMVNGVVDVGGREMAAADTSREDGQLNTIAREIYDLAKSGPDRGYEAIMRAESLAVRIWQDMQRSEVGYLFRDGSKLTIDWCVASTTSVIRGNHWRRKTTTGSTGR